MYNSVSILLNFMATLSEYCNLMIVLVLEKYSVYFPNSLMCMHGIYERGIKK